jgi:hypothetical protein
MRSAVVTAKDHGGALMEGIENIGREIHPGTLRFGSRPIAGVRPDRHPETPISSEVPTRGEPAGERPRRPVTRSRG